MSGISSNEKKSKHKGKLNWNLFLIVVILFEFLIFGAVVMNRLRSGAYPSSISGVIYQSGQFPPAGRGMVASIAANGPKGSCVQAAQQALGGSDNTGGATCFSRASSGRAGVVIGNHVFY